MAYGLEFNEFLKIIDLEKPKFVYFGMGWNKNKLWFRTQRDIRTLYITRQEGHFLEMLKELRERRIEVVGVYSTEED